MDGNPIREVVAASKDFDLLVLPQRRRKRAFLTKPDIGLNLIHKASCSVMVMPV
jgi:hypothetical protein